MLYDTKSRERQFGEDTNGSSLWKVGKGGDFPAVFPALMVGEQ